jgi:Cu/Ag efflux protein CusF
MKKVLGLTLALALALPMTALAMEKGGTVKSVDPASHTFTLEDGTQLTISTGAMSQLQPGEQVRASYDVQDGKNVVTEINRVTKFSDGQIMTNLGGTIQRSDIEAP